MSSRLDSSLDEPIKNRNVQEKLFNLETVHCERQNYSLTLDSYVGSFVNDSNCYNAVIVKLQSNVAVTS